MDLEVICISSDEESESQKENKTDKSLTNSTEIGNGLLVHAKIENLSSNNEKVKGNHLKRKKLQTDKEEVTHNNMGKKKKLNTDQGTSKVINKPVSDLHSVYIPAVCLVKSDCNAQSNKDQKVTIEKTQLVVKEKKKISYIPQDVFPLFISLCLQKCPEHDKSDMNKIVDKLKRRYENLDPIYARSENFVSFLNEKREAIMNNSKKVYVHIEEVMNEMKKKIKKNSPVLQNNEIFDAVPSTSYATNDVPVNNVAEMDHENDDEDDDNDDNYEENASFETRKKIKQVLCTMRKCEAIIKKLEEEEVDFDQENDSNYVKVERYKRRMVELYNKLCELTGENADAGRVYLRPKHLNTTRIVVVDQAITNFINAKITQRNQKKKTGALTNDLIFPDYRDILECVTRCNDRKKLGLDENKRVEMAKNAFIVLGEHLQRTRRNDYWDTFSLYLENTGEDPAVKDKNLAKRLAENRTKGENRLAAIFEKYTKKQEEIKGQINEETASEEDEEEEEEESIIDDEDKSEDYLSIISEKDSDNEEDTDRRVKENKSLTDKNKSNISMVNVYHATDKAISTKTVVETLQEKCNKKVKIKASVKENDTAVSKDENKTISKKIVHKPCNPILIVKKVMDTETQEDSLSAEDIAEEEIEAVPKIITDPTIKKMTKDAADAVSRETTDVITRVTAKPTPGNTAGLITGGTAELITGGTPELVTGDTTELITEDIPETITEDETEITENMDGAIENMPNDEQPEEEKKTLLRVRSFAKPPTTWEDNEHKTDTTAQGNAPKVANQNKEIVDLTNEGAAKSSPVVTKRAIQIGNKVIPIVIPTNSNMCNIISVKNITNNNNYANALRQILPMRDIRGSKLIRVPVQTTSQQNQPQNANAVRKEVPLKGNEKILRIIPKNMSVIVSKKPTVQLVSKQTDVSSSTTKPK